MAHVAHKWMARETDTLIAHLVKGTVFDMQNPRQLGYFMEVVASMPSWSFCATITREDVVRQVMNLRSRYERFVRYIVIDEVSYDVGANKVRVNGLFKKRFRKEPRPMGLMLCDGEPRFIKLRRIFIDYCATGELWAWLLDAFRWGQYAWLTDSVVVPLMGLNNNNGGAGGDNHLPGCGQRQEGWRH